MEVMIDHAVSKRCWNPYESYGEICVGCGCCSKDKAKRYKARYELCQRRIDDLVSFDGWFDEPELRELQERNIATDLKHFRQRMAYYRKKLEGIRDEDQR